MRAFKYISFLVIFLFLLGTLFASFPKLLPLYKSYLIESDTYFRSQLNVLSKINDQRQVILYGSSGMLVGVSAEALESHINNVKVTNLSTIGTANELDNALRLILERIHQGDVLILGDRSYRNGFPSLLDNLPNIYFLPNFKNYIIKENQIKRSFYGDFIEYPISNFNLKQLNNYSDKPNFNPKNLKKMKSHIDEIKRAGGCPIIVFIPLLIKEEDRAAYENETKKLLFQIYLMGMSDYVLNLVALETEPNFFYDQYHLNNLGRQNWSNKIIGEILKRNICNLN